MPNRRTRDRQLAKLAARRQAERRRKQRQRAWTLGISSVLVVGAAVLLWFVFKPASKPAAATTPTPHHTPTVSPTPTVQASPGTNCGYTASPQQGSGKKGTQVPPKFTIDVNKTFAATVQTSMGTITLSLDPKAAPCTVNSFVYLARKHFYDGLTFHRVVKGFVIQGGDPTGTGSGGPGYTFNDELNNGLVYNLGALAMANSGPNTNGSQWFIVAGAQGGTLPNNYTIFGMVTKGQDVVTKIEAVPTKGGTGPDKDMPVKPVTIVKVTIQVTAK